MKTVEEIKAAIEAAVPGAGVEIVPNPARARSTRCVLAPSMRSQWRRFCATTPSWRSIFFRT